MSMSPLEDLWPEDIPVDVRSPLVILSHQASLIGKRTKGLIAGSVATTTEGPVVEHRLMLRVDSLSFSCEVLKVTHAVDLPYPAKIVAPCFDLRGSWRDAYPTGYRWVSSQDDLIGSIKTILSSPESLSTLHAITAKANEGLTPA